MGDHGVAPRGRMEDLRAQTHGGPLSAEEEGWVLESACVRCSRRLDGDGRGRLLEPGALGTALRRGVCEGCGVKVVLCVCQGGKWRNGALCLLKCRRGKSCNVSRNIAPFSGVFRRWGVSPSPKLRRSTLLCLLSRRWECLVLVLPQRCRLHL